MKLRLISVVVLLAVLAGASVLYIQKKERNQLVEMQVWKKMLKKRAAIGTKDDPEARARWEFNRLKDPATGRIPENIRRRELSYAAGLPTREQIIGRALAKGERVNQVLSWVKRGPVNVGGRTRGFKADVTDANILIAGGVSGGLWRSTDDGASWNKMTTASQLHSVTALAQDVRTGQESVWYAGSGERFGNSASSVLGAYYGDGIYKSTDGGISWTLLSATASNTPQSFDSAFDFVFNVVVDPSDGEVYAAASNVISRSTNGGTTWSTVLGTLANNSPTDVAVTSTGVVYAALNSGVANAGLWRSTDGGAGNWTQINAGVSGFPTTYARIVIGIAPSNENAIYFLIQGANGTEGVDQINGHQLWKYVYSSGDGSGANGTWVNKGASLPNEIGKDGNAIFDTQGGYDQIVHVKPDNENYVIIGGVNLYRTPDFSVSTPAWTRIGGYQNKDTYAPYGGVSPSTQHHPDLHSGFFRQGSNSIYYSGHDGGLTKTADVTAGPPVAWTKLNNGYETSQFYTLAIDQATSGNPVVIGGTQDNGTWWTNTTTSSTAWVSQFSGDGAYCAIADGRTSYYLSSQLGNMYRVVLDAGGNWVDWANIQPKYVAGYPDGYQFINPFVLDPNNTNMMYVAIGDTIWRNSDLTGIATQVDQPTTTNWLPMGNTNVTGGDVISLAVSKTPANRLYYATFDFSDGSRFVYRVDAANTGDPTPADITFASFPSQGYVTCIAVDPTNADNILVVFSNYSVPSVFSSTNGGTNWTDVSGNLEQNSNGTGNGPSVRWASIVPVSGTTNYFVATSTGVYSTSTLNGLSTSWAQEGASVIGNVVVDMLAARPSDGLVVAATHGNGIFSSNILVSAPTPEPGVPLAYGISQNYPNPFNPSTTISYTLPKQSRVNITVYDIGGREISVLVNKTMSAGPQSVVWNATDLRGAGVPSGVYFYTIRATPLNGGEPFAKTEKMTYVK